MLIVTRSLQQSVIVGEFEGLELMLKVTVLGVRGKKVRLGFEVLSGDPASPSEVREQSPDGPSIASSDQGFAETQEWNWGEEIETETGHR